LPIRKEFNIISRRSDIIYKTWFLHS
jgi:hypothetical protein